VQIESPGNGVSFTLRASLLIAVAFLAFWGLPQPDAHAVAMRESACLAGVPWAEEGRTGCALSAPSRSDLGRPVVALVAPGERYLYVVEQAYSVGYGGGGYSTGGDTIIQERLDGAASPQFVSCVSQGRTPDCALVSDPAAMFDVQSAIISPSGQDMYVASRTGISRFAIEPSGVLQFQECIGLEGGDCVHPTWSPTVDETEQITIAPDGRDLYSVTEGKLTDFHIAADSALRLDRCYQFRSVCRARGAWETYGMAAVTPDGHTVLSVLTSSHVNVYRRQPDGSLRFATCLAGDDEECPSVGRAAAVMRDLKSIVVAPNGRDVYVTGGTRAWDVDSSAITHLRLTPAGALEFAGCLAVEVNGCGELPRQVAPLSGAGPAGHQLAMTADGGTLLMPGHRAIEAFKVDSQTGELEWEACAGSEPLCEPAQVASIEGQGGTIEMAPGVGGAWVSDTGSGRAARFYLNVPAAPVQGSPPSPGVVTSQSYPSQVFEHARIGAWVKPNGSPTQSYFEYEASGTGTRYVGAEANESGEAGQHFEGEADVEPGSTNRIRIVSRNAGGIAYGPWSSIHAEPCDVEGAAPSQNGGTPDVGFNPTTMAAWGNVSAGCLPTSITLEYGIGHNYEDSVTLPSSSLSVRYRQQQYHLEATGLEPATLYSWRLSATNRKGTYVLDANEHTTPPTLPTIELDATTGPATAEGATATLHGVVTPGDTRVSASAEIYDETREGAEPSQVISLGELSPSRESIPLAASVAGLECGRTYVWRLAASAQYGDSVGAREAFAIPCEGATTTPGAPEESEPSPPDSTPKEVLTPSPGNGLVAGAPDGGLAPLAPSPPATLGPTATRTPNAGYKRTLRISDAVLLQASHMPPTVRLTIDLAVPERIAAGLVLMPRRGQRAKPLTLGERTLVLPAGPSSLELRFAGRAAEQRLRTHASWQPALVVRRAAGPTVTLRLHRRT
jgi:hypothetical protein